MTTDTIFPATDYEPPEPPAPPQKPRMRAGLAALLLAVGAAGGSGIVRLAWPGSSDGGTNLTSINAGSNNNSSSNSVNASAVAAKVDDAVVNITIRNDYQGERAAGTGIVLTSNGEVLTNNHVIAGATSINATDVGNGQTYTATVLGYDRTRDIALIKLHGASGLQTANLGDSSNVNTGDTVVGIGNAGGQGGTPSYAAGSVTGLDQPVDASDPGQGTVEHLTGLIETDANIVAGESGGPLTDKNGKVIGVITAGSSSFRFQFQPGTSDGYAVPINTALSIVHQIESGSSSGTVHVGPTAFLGVQVQGGSSYGGATIAGVISDEPADRAGLTSGDTITSVDGHAVASPNALSTVMQHEQPGRDVRVVYVDRYGVQHHVTVHLVAGPAQ